MEIKLTPSELRCQVGESVVISGTTTDGSGNRAELCPFEVRNQHRALLTSGATEADGSFAFELQPTELGRLRLQVSVVKPSGMAVSCGLRLIVGNDAPTDATPESPTAPMKESRDTLPMNLEELAAFMSLIEGRDCGNAPEDKQVTQPISLQPENSWGESSLGRPVEPSVMLPTVGLPTDDGLSVMLPTVETAEPASSTASETVVVAAQKNADDDKRAKETMEAMRNVRRRHHRPTRPKTIGHDPTLPCVLMSPPPSEEETTLIKPRSSGGRLLAIALVIVGTVLAIVWWNQRETTPKTGPVTNALAESAPNQANPASYKCDSQTVELVDGKLRFKCRLQ